MLWNVPGGPYSRWPSSPYDITPFPFKNGTLVGSRGGGGGGARVGGGVGPLAPWSCVVTPPVRLLLRSDLYFIFLLVGRYISGAGRTPPTLSCQCSFLSTTGGWAERAEWLHRLCRGPPGHAWARLRRCCSLQVCRSAGAFCPRVRAQLAWGWRRSVPVSMLYGSCSVCSHAPRRPRRPRPRWLPTA